MGTWMHVHGTKFENNNNKKTVLPRYHHVVCFEKKKNKNFHAKNVYCRERVHLCLDHVDNPAFK